MLLAFDDIEGIITPRQLIFQKSKICVDITRGKLFPVLTHDLNT